MKMYSEVTRTCRAKKVSQYNFSEATHVLHISSCINLDPTEFASVTSEFTEYLLLTVDCHQQIYRIFAINSRLSPATPKKNKKIIIKQNIEKCETITIHVGGNDADEWEDIESFRENYEELLDIIAHGTRGVLVSELLPRETVDLQLYNETLTSLIIFMCRQCRGIRWELWQLSACHLTVSRFLLSQRQATYEPRHDKINKITVRPAKTQISLGIRPIWSESSLSAWRKFGS